MMAHEFLMFTKRELNSILEASKIRNDGLVEGIASMSGQNFAVHDECRKVYMRKRDLTAVKTASP